MKTRKIIFVLTVALAFILAFITCDNGDDNKPDVAKDQTATRTLAHGVGTVTITGFMTNAQWRDVADKIVTDINDCISGDISNLDAYKTLFGRGLTYIVEPSPVGYINYKTTGDGKTVYIALSKTDMGLMMAGEIMLVLYQSGKVVDGIPIP
jgi:hypothetical protein